MSTNKQTEGKSSSNWSSLEELEHSRYKTAQKNSAVSAGTRPTIKAMKGLDILTAKEDSLIREANIKADNDVKGFLEKIKQEEDDLKKAHLIKQQVASLNNEEISASKVVSEKTVDTSQSSVADHPEVSFIKQNIKAKSEQLDQSESFKFSGTQKNSAVREVFLGFGRLYINKTNNILNPLRFVLDNKEVVLKAIMLFIIPAIMTWFFTTQIPSIQMELAKENFLLKSVYAVIFYFASMFVLFTLIITGNAIVNSILGSIKNAQKIGRD